MIIRPLTPDFPWDQYDDLVARAFGPGDETLIRPSFGPLVAAGRNLGAFDGDRLAGTALYHDLRQWWYGRPVPMAGVAGVKVAPEYRGQGVGRGDRDRYAYLAQDGFLAYHWRHGHDEIFVDRLVASTAAATAALGAVAASNSRKNPSMSGAVKMASSRPRVVPTCL